MDKAWPSEQKPKTTCMLKLFYHGGSALVSAGEQAICKQE